MGVGEFINRLVNDTTRVMELIDRLVRMFCREFIVVIVFIIAFKFSLLLGLEIIICSIIMGLISAKFLPKIKHPNELSKKKWIYMSKQGLSI